jgi:hypothetical protein
VQDPPTSLEASLAAPPRMPRNASRKRVSKKLKDTETTSPEVSRLELVWLSTSVSSCCFDD